jgi:hypothetical protein
MPRVRCTQAVQGIAQLLVLAQRDSAPWGARAAAQLHTRASPLREAHGALSLWRARPLRGWASAWVRRWIGSDAWRDERLGRLADALGCDAAAAEELARERPALLQLGPYALRRLASPSHEAGASPGHGAKAGAPAPERLLHGAVVDAPCSLQMRAMHWGERGRARGYELLCGETAGKVLGGRGRPPPASQRDGRRASPPPLPRRRAARRRRAGMRLHLHQLIAHCEALGHAVDSGKDFAVVWLGPRLQPRVVRRPHDPGRAAAAASSQAARPSPQQHQQQQQRQHRRQRQAQQRVPHRPQQQHQQRQHEQRGTGGGSSGGGGPYALVAYRHGAVVLLGAPALAPGAEYEMPDADAAALSRVVPLGAFYRTGRPEGLLSSGGRARAVCPGTAVWRAAGGPGAVGVAAAILASCGADEELAPRARLRSHALSPSNRCAAPAPQP